MENKETLEEYIKEVTKNFKDEMSIKFTSGGIKLGAKWQQERSYSEEEVIKIIYQLHLEMQTDKDFTFMKVDEWFKQFKKK
jgi:hypothetical protein